MSCDGRWPSGLGRCGPPLPTAPMRNLVVLRDERRELPCSAEATRASVTADGPTQRSFVLDDQGVLLCVAPAADAVRSSRCAAQLVFPFLFSPRSGAGPRCWGTGALTRPRPAAVLAHGLERAGAELRLDLRPVCGRNRHSHLLRRRRSGGAGGVGHWRSDARRHSARGAPRAAPPPDRARFPATPNRGS